MNEQERQRRWRLILGEAGSSALQLQGDDVGLDACLAAVYASQPGEEDDFDERQSRRAGLGASSPKIARWLGDIRRFFPRSVVRIMQKDAIDRLGLEQLLL